MDFLQPTSWAEALAARAERPDAVPIAGGTDVMVDLNFDRRRPGALLDLGRVPELREWTAEDGPVRLGAGVPYARIIDELGGQLPGLAMASRTVGLAADPHPRHGRGQPRARRPRPVTRTRRCWRPTRSSRSSRPPAARGGSRSRSSSPA